MNCKKAERKLLRSLDGVIEEKEKGELEKHMKSCSRCKQKEEEYKRILSALKRDVSEEPLPYFWERLQVKLKEREESAPWLLWKEWSLRTLPFFLAVIVFFAAAVLFFPSYEREELSQSEILLLRNDNPLAETRTLFEEEKLENRNMMLIFASMEEQPTDRRYFP